MPEDTYTHGHHDSVLRSHRWRTVENSATYLVPHLRPGLSVLDVGCGPGTITADLARRVSPGPVLGLDLVLRHPGGSGLVGLALGRPDPELSPRRAGRRRRPRHS